MESLSYVALKSQHNNKYLRYVHEDVQIHGYLQFSGEEVVTSYTKFFVETSKNHQRLVHIRCCYNNKYWVRSSKNQWWIVAGADEPDEDRSSWLCTLFEPVYVGSDGQTARFRHVQLGHYVSLRRISLPYDSCLFAGSASPSVLDLCTIIDWKSILILPKHIAFKGYNGLYLSARTIQRYPYLQFASKDIGDPTVHNEVFTTHDGSVGIKNHHFGKFWRRSPNWIWADSNDSTTTNSDTLFWPVRVDNNVIALRNLGNNNFCSSLTADRKTDCLNAAVPTVTREARVEVEELVLSRDISNVNFRLMDARIYGQSVVMTTRQQATNMTQELHTKTLVFSYEETKTRKWNATVSAKLGAKLTIRSGVPIIASGKLEISAEVSGEYEWGETQTIKSRVETSYTVPVPPMTRVIVTMLAMQGWCDVPFSYTQRDIMIDGRDVIRTMDDGVFSGQNNFDFIYETVEEKL